MQASSPLPPALNSSGSMGPRPMLRMGSISGNRALMNADPSAAVTSAQGGNVAEVGGGGGHAQKKVGGGCGVHSWK
eukprot:1158163-Pelagomonas_calceolata.AAC.10